MPVQSIRPVPELLDAIVTDIREIIRSQIRLAKAETVEEAAALARGAGVLVAGGILAVFALGFLLLAGVYALSRVVEPWLASLIVSLAAGGIALAVIGAGMKRLRAVHVGPDRTIESIKETVRWVKHQTRSNATLSRSRASSETTSANWKRE